MSGTKAPILGRKRRAKDVGHHEGARVRAVTQWARGAVAGYAVAALSVVFGLSVWAAPAHAESDGYTDNFAGDLTFGGSHWDLAQGAYVPDFSSTTTGLIRTHFDDQWKALRDTFCSTLEKEVRQHDDGWQKTNHCTPTPYGQADLSASVLGPDLFGFRYFIPGFGKSIYAYDSEHYDYTQNVDISFDVTIDVSVRVAPGTGGPDADAASSPLSLDAARLTFSNARVTASVCNDSCAAGERTINGTVEDVTDKFGLSDVNNLIHSNLAQYSELDASLSSTAAQLEFFRDTVPAFDSSKPVTSLAWSTPFGSVRTVLAVDTSGMLDVQTSYSNGPYGHWYRLGKPPGTTIVSAPAGVVGSDASRHVFVRAANGHIDELFDERNWIDHGRPPATTAAGAPVAAISGALPRVVVRGANGHIDLLSEAASGTWSWLDLGAPGAASFRPQLVDAPPYTAVEAITSTGHLVVREANGASWRRWRDLGAFPVPPSSNPSATFNGASVTTYVTGSDHRIEQASFTPFGRASFGPLKPYRTHILPRVSSAPAAALTETGDPTIFAVDTTGTVVQFVWTRQPVLGLFTGFTARSYGTLLATTMRAPAAAAALGAVTAFVTAANQHIAETTVAGSLPGLVDHTAVSRVQYQARSSGSASWLPVVQEGQSSAAPGAVFDDEVRVQSTGGVPVQCQAHISGIGWRPEVNDGQPCGAPGGTIDGLRFWLADGSSGLHVLYRCRTLAGWMPWVADGTACNSSGLAPINGIQLAYGDAAVSAVGYRTHAQNLLWQPWADETATSGAPGGALDGIEVHSNVGGNLRCQPYVDIQSMTAHLGSWRPPVDSDTVCGDVEEDGTLYATSLEAFTLTLDAGPPGEHVQYRSFIAGSWLPWVQDGQVSGLPGQRQPIQQIQIRLTHTP